MKRKNKGFMTLCVTLTLICVFQIFAFAFSWSDAGTFELDSDTGTWVYYTTANTKLGDAKTTDDALVTVYTISKTMGSSPKFRLVRANGDIRSEKITTGEPGEAVSGSSTGGAGNTYYASMAAAWNQVTNNKTIRIKFDSH